MPRHQACPLHHHNAKRVGWEGGRTKVQTQNGRTGFVSLQVSHTRWSKYSQENPWPFLMRHTLLHQVPARNSTHFLIKAAVLLSHCLVWCTAGHSQVDSFPPKSSCAAPRGRALLIPYARYVKPPSLCRFSPLHKGKKTPTNHQYKRLQKQPRTLILTHFLGQPKLEAAKQMGLQDPHPSEAVSQPSPLHIRLTFKPSSLNFLLRLEESKDGGLGEQVENRVQQQQQQLGCFKENLVGSLRTILMHR